MKKSANREPQNKPPITSMIIFFLLAKINLYGIIKGWWLNVEKDV